MKRIAKVLLQDPHNNYLLLTRSKHPRFGSDPDLPGGTLDRGEDIETTAVREVYEETGISIPVESLRHVHTSSGYSKHGSEYTLYTAQLTEQPAVTLSWEHAAYTWLSKDDLLAAAQASEDTFMMFVLGAIAEPS